MYEVWFLSDIELDCDSIQARNLKEAVAIATEAYGKSLVEVRGVEA